MSKGQYCSICKCRTLEPKLNIPRCRENQAQFIDALNCDERRIREIIGKYRECKYVQVCKNHAPGYRYKKGLNYGPPRRYIHFEKAEKKSTNEWNSNNSEYDLKLSKNEPVREIIELRSNLADDKEAVITFSTVQAPEENFYQDPDYSPTDSEPSSIATSSRHNTAYTPLSLKTFENTNYIVKGANLLDLAKGRLCQRCGKPFELKVSEHGGCARILFECVCGNEDKWEASNRMGGPSDTAHSINWEIPIGAHVTGTPYKGGP